MSTKLTASLYSYIYIYIGMHVYIYIYMCVCGGEHHSTAPGKDSNRLDEEMWLGREQFWSISVYMATVMRVLYSRVPYFRFEICRTDLANGKIMACEVWIGW